MCVYCFIRVWFITCREPSLQILCWLTCRPLQAFCTCKDSSIYCVFDVWPFGLYLRMFRIHHFFYVCICLVKDSSLLTPFVPTSQMCIYIRLFTMCLHLKCASGGLTYLMSLESNSYVNLEVFVYFL